MAAYDGPNRLAALVFQTPSPVLGARLVQQQWRTLALRWDDRLVSQARWDALSQVEKAFMINGVEIDILPGVWGDLPEAMQDAPLGEMADVLLALVDRGWLEVRRLAPWIAPDGGVGSGPGDLVPREQLPIVLADPREWEYPADPSSWVGALTLVETDAGRRLTR